MSELWKRTINNREVLFVNSSRNTRHGFAHDTEVFIDGWKYGSNTCHYLNRTWECYRYQTVMRGCIWNLIESRKMDLIRDFKNKHGYEKLTAKRKGEFEAEISNDKDLELYNAILEELR